PAPTGPHRGRSVWDDVSRGTNMIFRSAFALGLLATGLAIGAAQAQPYPPSYYPPGNTQAYPPYRAPVPPGAMADDDDDDLPPHLRAAPGNYPPPPGGYVFPADPRAAAPGGVQREALPAPGAGAPYYG